MKKAVAAIGILLVIILFLSTLFFSQGDGLVMASLVSTPLTYVSAFFMGGIMLTLIQEKDKNMGGNQLLCTEMMKRR